MSNAFGLVRRRRIVIAVGPGIADVSVADVNQDGRLDILLANQTSGEVEVILNQGAAGFGPPTLYRAGIGLSAVSAASDTTPLSLTSQEGTVGVAGAPTSGGPPDIVALNAGSDTIGVLDGLGGGRFANPISLPTTGPTLAVADLNDDGNADLAILGPDGLTIWLGNGKGGFVPSATYQSGRIPPASRSPMSTATADPICSSATRSATSSCCCKKRTAALARRPSRTRASRSRSPTIR